MRASLAANELRQRKNHRISLGLGTEQKASFLYQRLGQIQSDAHTIKLKSAPSSIPAKKPLIFDGGGGKESNLPANVVPAKAAAVLALAEEIKKAASPKPTK